MLSGSRDTRGTPYFDPLAFEEQGFVNLTEHKAITGELGTTVFPGSIPFLVSLW